LFIAALLTRGRLRRTFFWLILLLFSASHRVRP
jgi:hypothetical protein